ncbi:MAG: hypothetical protein KC549_03890 [Myxococcales bacterium]|nr:hypothetical protein [Myxococcales bacterium]
MIRLIFLWFCLTAGAALAQEAPPPPPVAGASTPGSAEGAEPQSRGRAWGMAFIFWSGAVSIMALVGRVVFKEQLNQLRTQRMLIRQIGPFFPEFDTDFLTTWVHRCAPHVWNAWQTHDLTPVASYLTPAFQAEASARYAADAAAGRRHTAKLEKVLRAHYLSLTPVGEGPPPRGLELLVRLECRGVHGVVDASGKVVEGSLQERQVQQFWTLRHDGHRWQLHQVEPATGDRTDLARRPLPPPLMEWKRPAEPADGRLEGSA